MPDPGNILIVRLSAIGDVVMASPLIGALRRTYPEARITWLVEEQGAEVLEGNPDLNEVIVWPRKSWRRWARQGHYLKLLNEAVGLIRRLRRIPRFDLAIDAQGLLKSGVWTFLSGAGERVGIGSREGSGLLMTRVIDRSGSGDRISSQYLLCAQAMGLEVSDFSMHVATDPGEDRFVDSFLAGHDISSGYAVICPFTTRPQKHWVEERWAEVADELARNHGLPTVILGGPDDADEADAIIGMTGETVKNSILNAAGRTTIRQVAGLIKLSTILIGVDTGLTHMGIALGTPTVALFGATRPYLDTGSDRAVVLYHPMECSPCRRDPTCDGEYTCMKAIGVDEVLNTAESLLKGPGEVS